MTETAAPPKSMSIAEVAEVTGLSIDTLRWYEREQLFPPVSRDSGRRRRYTADDLSRIQLMLRLRRTGMPVKDIRRFVELLAGGPETHPERLALLQSHRSRILLDMESLSRDLSAVDFKIDHYTELVANESDCQRTG